MLHKQKYISHAHACGTRRLKKKKKEKDEGLLTHSRFS